MKNVIMNNNIYLCFREIQGFGQFFSFLTNNVLVFLESLFQLQQLARRKSRADSFWLAER